MVLCAGGGNNAYTIFNDHDHGFRRASSSVVPDFLSTRALGYNPVPILRAYLAVWVCFIPFASTSGLNLRLGSAWCFIVRKSLRLVFLMYCPGSALVALVQDIEVPPSRGLVVFSSLPSFILLHLWVCVCGWV